MPGYVLNDRGGRDAPYLSSTHNHRENAVDNAQLTLDLTLLEPLIALIAGVLILFIPRLLNYIVAIYLIIVGALGLLGHF